MTTPEPPIEQWQDAIEAAIRSHNLSCVRRVMVLRETPSTQEAAGRATSAPGALSTLVVADRQTAGRGRLGRTWIQGNSHSDGAHGAAPRGLGVAATFALVGLNLSAAHLSLAAGLGALRASAYSLGAGVLGLRWPNDVVERAGAQRKLSGVLVETTARAALVGIGINVAHDVEDFPGTLAERAASLHQLGSSATRLDVLLELVRAFDETLKLPIEALAAEWSTLDTLIGSRRMFVQGGRRHEGIVRSIQPTSHIEVETDDGNVQLPALSTALVHE